MEEFEELFAIIPVLIRPNKVAPQNSIVALDDED